MQCKKCSKEFIITDADRAFYNKMNVPEPTHCPDCRMQRRLAWRNERILYPRTCDLCHKQIVSIYPAGTTFPVYCHQCWWSDKWEPLDYGQDFDFNKSFFEQWDDLLKKTPLPNVLQSNCTNCDYVHAAGNDKNCYLIFCSSDNEDSAYSFWLQKSRDCFDCSHANNCEGCYEGVDCEDCYNLIYSQYCLNCLDSAFLYDCRGCQNCFGCFGLRNASYQIYNEQYSREDYLKKIEEFNLGNYDVQKKIFADFRKRILALPRPYQSNKKSEQVIGDYFVSSANCYNCFTVKYCENLRYCQDMLNCRDSMDVTLFGNPGDWLYECNNCGLGANNVLFSSYCYGATFAEYCYQCHNSTELFGCVSLHQQNKFCILNKQYDEATYKELKTKIIEQMSSEGGSASGGKKTGEYGEFPDPQYAVSGYNETAAMNFFPLNKESVLSCGWTWQDQGVGTYDQETLSWDEVANNIKDVSDSILKEVLVCQKCKKNFKLIPLELKFYKNHNLAIPQECHDCRHFDRMSLRNPRQLWSRQCMCEGCNNEFETTYSPDRPEKVYCESCYQKEIY